MKRFISRSLASVILFTASLAGADAQVVLTPEISGNVLTADIQLPGGVEADLTIVYEQVTGLDAGALTLTAELVDPSDPSLLARLPAGGLVSILATFPVLVRIEPTSSSTLSFTGVVNVSLHTHNLTLIANSPLRIFGAPSGGGMFRDMTSFLEPGSMKAGGSRGNHSDFMILSDSRPLNAVILDKLGSLESSLQVHAAAMRAPVTNDLFRRLTNARRFYQAGATAQAISAVSGFSDQVKKQSGTAIPYVYLANSSLVNVAGILRAGAETLKLSLAVEAGGVPGP